MDFPQTADPKKNNKIIWIIVAVAAVLLCCCLAAVAIGGYYLYTQNAAGNLFPSQTIPLAPSAPTAAVAPVEPPAATEEAVATTAPIEGPLVVDPFDPTKSNLPTLQQLAPGWKDSTAPGIQALSLSMPRTQAVMLFMGWCTSSSALLEQNLAHMHWTLVVDGQPVDMNSLFLWNSQESDRICRTHVGIVRQWTGTSHVISVTMTIEQQINDGWSDYPAGNYTDVYSIKVTP
jgi:hypothetical protein